MSQIPDQEKKPEPAPKEGQKKEKGPPKKFQFKEGVTLVDKVQQQLKDIKEGRDISEKDKTALTKRKLIAV